MPCWRAPLNLLGTAPDVCSGCSPLDTLLGFGKTLVEFSRFAFLRCLVSLPFRADGPNILDILASGVPADFRQPSRTAGAIYVEEHFAQSGGSIAVMSSSAADHGHGGAMGFGVWLTVV